MQSKFGFIEQDWERRFLRARIFTFQTLIFQSLNPQYDSAVMFGGIQGVSEFASMIPRDASLSDSYMPDRCCFSRPLIECVTISPYLYLWYEYKVILRINILFVYVSAWFMFVYLTKNVHLLLAYSSRNIFFQWKFSSSIWYDTNFVNVFSLYLWIIWAKLHRPTKKLFFFVHKVS